MADPWLHLKTNCVFIGDWYKDTNWLKPIDELVPFAQESLPLLQAAPFLLGTEEYYGRSGVGPFAMFWDALYD